MRDFFYQGNSYQDFSDLCGPISRTYILEGARDNLLNFLRILAQSFILGVDKSAVRQNRSGIEIKKGAFFSSHVFWDRIGCETLGLGRWGI